MKILPVLVNTLKQRYDFHFINIAVSKVKQQFHLNLETFHQDTLPSIFHLDKVI